MGLLTMVAGENAADYSDDQTVADIYPQQNTFGQQKEFAVNPFYTYVQPASSGVASFGQGDSLAMGDSGVAAGTGESWFDQTFGKAFDWFDKKGDKTQGALLTIGGSFLQGLFSAKASERKLKASEKASEASMMNAQSNADALALKKETLANSQISGTSFGAKPAPLKYNPANFAARQKRAGYQGA